MNDRKEILSKVPEVTIFFWIIKVLCTTVGETAADFLNVNLGFGLNGTSIALGFLLAVALVIQFRTTKYIPTVYWITVVLVSVFGTLITDNLSDNLGFPLELSTLIFFGALMVTFVVWFAVEKTLSIHSIVRRRREVFYWLAILFTFALGTASGDLMAERLGLGYLATGLIVAGVITLVSLGWRLKLDPVLSFWIVYILTRPLGASFGDLLTQAPTHGGLGLGVPLTSAVFLVAILATVVYLSVSKRDLEIVKARPGQESRSTAHIWQTLVVVGIFILVSVGGYVLRQNQLAADGKKAQQPFLQSPAPGSVMPSSSGPLGDLTQLRIMVDTALADVESNNVIEANRQGDEMERWWDDSQARLRPLNRDEWRKYDAAMDGVLRQLRAMKFDSVACETAIKTLDQLLGQQ